MDRGSVFGQTCSCGRVISHVGAFKNHQNNCKKSKKRLSIALAKIKEIASLKRSRDRDALSNDNITEPTNAFGDLETEILVSNHNESMEV